MLNKLRAYGFAEYTGCIPTTDKTELNWDHLQVLGKGMPTKIYVKTTSLEHLPERPGLRI